MSTYEQLQKESGTINIWASPTYYQSTSYVNHDDVKEKVYKEIKIFAKENNINLKIVLPDGRGGGFGGGASEFLFNLFENRGLIISGFLILKNLSRILKELIADMKPIDQNEKGNVEIYVESYISLDTSFEDDANIGGVVENYTNSIKFMNELIRKLDSKFPIYQIHFNHNLYYNPTNSVTLPI